MEFLRFGSSIPGAYWGCCACCIIQDFRQDPDDLASIQLVAGDGGHPVMKNGKMLFAGPTWRDIFWQRIRVGTFDNRDMPNHAFLAILTDRQIETSVGRKWLAILKEAGFEFVRSVSNSVYTGQGLSRELKGSGRKLNYIFGLFRNIGEGGPSDPFTPPLAWTDLPAVKAEAWQEITNPKELAKEQHKQDREIWDKIGPATFLTEAELVAAGAPVYYAGQRSEFPPALKEHRMHQLEAKKAKAKAAALGGGPAPSGPWK